MAMIVYRHLHWPHFAVRATPGRFEKVQPKYFCLKIESTPNSFAFFLILPPFARRLPHRKEKEKNQQNSGFYIFVNPTPDMYSSNSSIETRMVIARTNPQTKIFKKK